MLEVFAHGRLRLSFFPLYVCADVHSIKHVILTGRDYTVIHQQNKKQCFSEASGKLGVLPNTDKCIWCSEHRAA